MYNVYDPDEYEMVSAGTPCTMCGGDHRRCNGWGCNGSFSMGPRRRSPEEIAKIKAERLRQREDGILAEAEAIRRRREKACE